MRSAAAKGGPRGAGQGLRDGARGVQRITSALAPAQARKATRAYRGRRSNAGTSVVSCVTTPLLLLQSVYQAADER